MRCSMQEAPEAPHKQQLLRHSSYLQTNLVHTYNLIAVNHCDCRAACVTGVVISQEKLPKPIIRYISFVYIS